MAASPSPFDKFGAFKPLFESSDGHVPGYLSLLNLQIGADRAVRQLRRALRDSGANRESSIVALLSDETGWRPQLVGAAAMVAGSTSSKCIDVLWEALDHICWTSPQLAAAASRVDPDFSTKARSRLEGRCRVMPFAKMVARLPPSAERDGLAQGHSSPKLMAALVALCERELRPDDWLNQLIEAPDVVRLLSEDRDGGGEIALNWLKLLDDALLHTAEH